MFLSRQSAATLLLLAQETDGGSFNDDDVADLADRLVVDSESEDEDSVRDDGSSSDDGVADLDDPLVVDYESEDQDSEGDDGSSSDDDMASLADFLVVDHESEDKDPEVLIFSGSYQETSASNAVSHRITIYADPLNDYVFTISYH